MGRMDSEYKSLICPHECLMDAKWDEKKGRHEDTSRSFIQLLAKKKGTCSSIMTDCKCDNYLLHFEAHQ